MILAASLGAFFPAAAQSPATFAGSALGLVFTNTSGAFAGSGYAFMTFGGSGTTWRMLNLSGSANSSGNCVYTANGATGHLDWTDTAAGNFGTDFAFDSAFGGAYTVNDNVTGAQQQGNFILFSGTAPASVAGQSFLCTVNDGGGALTAAGVALLTLATNGNGYTIRGDGTYVPDSSGTYDYKASAAIGRLLLNDSVHGSLTGWFAFSGSGSGSFGLTAGADGFQVGDFTISDTARPTVAITSPTAGQRVSNEVFTVTGHASDNAGVALVVYSLNGLDWIEANSSDNWNTWTADVVLNPGTNVLQAYAMDNSGNFSVTNKVSFYYVVSAPLNISVNNAKNKISPDYRHALLEIGKPVKLTAQPAAGFVFSNWMDGAGNLLTNRPSLSFVMQPGLSFTANFADVAKPSAAILSPRSGQRCSNNVITVTGRAGDNDALAAVYFSVNGADWFSPIVAGTNWSASAALVPGTNHLAVYAVDATGNVSRTNTVNFQYIPCAILTANAGAGGKVTPPLNGQLVPLGQKVFLLAAPKSGFTFVNWKDADGNVVTNQPALTFLMASNLVFTARFLDTNRPVLTLRQGDGTNFTGQMRITGRATDNDAVAAVYCNLNGTGWLIANSSATWSNWWADVTLAPGTNWIYLIAADRTGNYSQMRQLKVMFQTAPLNLAGLKLNLLPDGTRPMEFTFGARTFGQVSPDVNAVSGAGNYTYTRLSPSSGRLQITYTAPPRVATTAAQGYNLNFTAPKVGRFTNDDGSLIGSLTYAPQSDMTVTSLVRRTVFYFGSQGDGLSTYYYHGTNYNTRLNDGSQFIGRTLAYTKYSPVTTLLKQTNASGTLFIFYRYTGTNYGITYTERYSADGSYISRDTGYFGLGVQQPGGNAPASLNGRGLAVSSLGGTFDLGFLAGTFSQQSFVEGIDTGVGSYTYGLTDTNTASLALTYTAPADVSGGTSSANLTFYAPNLAYILNADNTVSPANLWNLGNYAYGSAVGKTLSLTNNFNGAVASAQPGNDGKVNISGALTLSANYSVNPYSPSGDLYSLNIWGGSFSGNQGWLQLNYSTAANGTYKLTVFDYSNNPLSTEQGMFGQQ